MLQALNLRAGPPLLDRGSRLPAGRPGVAGTSVLVPGGPFVLGVDAVSEPHSLDNERPAHVVDVPTFRIGRVPVTNAEWRQFVDDGGYDEPRWWSDRGWSHRQQAGLTAPQFWNPGPAPAPASATSRTSRATNRSSTSRSSRPRRTRRGRGRGCPPRRNGRRPVPGIRGPGRAAASRGARRSPAEHLANLGGDALRPGAGRRLPGGRVGLRCRTDARRRVGVDHLAAAAVAGLHADDLRALLAAVLRRRLQGAARRLLGGGAPTSCGPASATGTIRSVGRSSPASGWPGM